MSKLLTYEEFLNEKNDEIINIDDNISIQNGNINVFIFQKKLMNNKEVQISISKKSLPKIIEILTKYKY